MSLESMHIFKYSRTGGPETSIALGKIQSCISRREGGLSVYVEGDDAEEPYIVPSPESERFRLEWQAFRIRVDRQFWAPVSAEDVIQAAAETI